MRQRGRPALWETARTDHATSPSRRIPLGSGHLQPKTATWRDLHRPRAVAPVGSAHCIRSTPHTSRRDLVGGAAELLLLVLDLHALLRRALLAGQGLATPAVQGRLWLPALRRARSRSGDVPLR